MSFIPNSLVGYKAHFFLSHVYFYSNEGRRMYTIFVYLAMTRAKHSYKEQEKNPEKRNICFGRMVPLFCSVCLLSLSPSYSYKSTK